MEWEKLFGWNQCWKWSTVLSAQGQQTGTGTQTMTHRNNFTLKQQTEVHYLFNVLSSGTMLIASMRHFATRYFGWNKHSSLFPRSGLSPVTPRPPCCWSTVPLPNLFFFPLYFFSFFFFFFVMKNNTIVYTVYDHKVVTIGVAMQKNCS